MSDPDRRDWGDCVKFIVSMGIRKPPDSPQPMHEIYRDFLEEAVLAEELGFDAVWASEHHFTPVIRA
jgi:alkanesulfonate monooxygenase SsuD/methylene tetrahydromethanopterin reductase-like flavin-dependent oxidoreductase (luciferase family)